MQMMLWYIYLGMMQLQNDIYNFKIWCQSNALTMNITKTKQIIFGTRHSIKKSQNINIHNDGKRISYVPNIRYLSFTLDSTMNLNSHTASVITLVSHKSYMLNLVRQYLTDKTAIKIYNDPTIF